MLLPKKLNCLHRPLNNNPQQKHAMKDPIVGSRLIRFSLHTIFRIFENILFLSLISLRVDYTQ